MSTETFVTLWKNYEENENPPIFRRIIQDYMLKIACKNVNSVKCYDKTNLEILTLSLWKKSAGA